MAAATVVKPVQTLRRRRPSMGGRPSSRVVNTDLTLTDATERKKLAEPYVRGSDYVLRKFRGKPPSLTIHLHPTHFRFDQQDGSFSYDSPMKAFLQHLRRQTVPHEFIQELLENKVAFYDGCLIVQVYDHKSTGNKTPTAGNMPTIAPDDSIPFSMHNYNEHITPSPFAPYPKKPLAQPTAPSRPSSAKQESEKDAAQSKHTHDGPRVTTLVLHPTPLSRHHEIMALASTPKTATDRSGSGLEEKDYYTFEAELLVSTEPPLLLDPAKDSDEAQKALDLLRHPLHSEAPPSPKARKRTHAEMAADDAQAAEEERRMLIMDERTKPSLRGNAGMSSTEGQTASVAIGFSRFKTLETIKKSHEENERKKKEEEAQKAMEKRQHDAQLAQKKRLIEERQRHEHAAAMQAKQQAMRQQQMQQHHQQQQQQQQQQQAAQHAQALAQAATPMPTNPQQHQLQQQAALAAQSSPIVRNPTPMMASSPLMANSGAMNMGGFPMQPTASNQGAGSPPRPTSAMQHANIAMARQMSQQQSQSRHATPQMAHGTPHMPASVPMDGNRQMSGTPQMQHRSPIPPHMQNTPNQAMMGATPQMNMQQGLTPGQQMAMMQQQRARMQAQAMQGSPGQGFTPEQMAMMRNQQNMALQQQQMNPQAYAQMQQRMQQQQQQMNSMQGGQAMMQSASGQQMNQAMSQNNQQTVQRVQAAQQARAQLLRSRQAMQQMAAAGQPITPEMRAQLQQQHNMAQAAQQQMAAAMRSSQQNLGDPNNAEQYMHNLRNQQALIARMQRNPQQGMNAGMMNGNGAQQQQQNMGMNMMQNPQMQQMRNQQPNADFAQQFARQAAMNQQRPGSGMG